jgi:hypothetical protein
MFNGQIGYFLVMSLKFTQFSIMENFNLRNFLTENKLTTNSKLLTEDREIRFVTDFKGGGNGHGEEYSAVVGYEKGNNVVFKLGDAGFDGVPSTVVIMPNSNIYHALQLFADEGYDVEQNKIKLDSEDEYAVDDLLDGLEDRGLVYRFDPEIDIHTEKDIDKYNSYLPDDEQYGYRDFGL